MKSLLIMCALFVGATCDVAPGFAEPALADSTTGERPKFSLAPT